MNSGSGYLGSNTNSLTMTAGSFTLAAQGSDDRFSTITCSGGSIIAPFSGDQLHATGDVDLTGLTAYTDNTGGHHALHFDNGAGTQIFKAPSAAVTLPILAISAGTTVQCANNGVNQQWFYFQRIGPELWFKCS